MNKKEILLAQIRILGETRKGRESLVTKIPEKLLYQVFKALRNGNSNRSIARMIKAKTEIEGSENSVAQSVAKLRKRIDQLLKTRLAPEKHVQTTKAPVPCRQIPDSHKRLNRLRKIEDDYAELIERQIAMASESDMLPNDLQKNVNALAALSKTRSKIEQTIKPSDSAPTREDIEFDEKAQFVMDRLIENDGDKMARAAISFLNAAQKYCVTCYYDEKEKKWLPAEERRSGERH